MDQIDIAIVKFFNGFAWQSTMLDRIITEILQMNTFKAMPMVCVMIWLWFSSSSTDQQRKTLFNGFLGALAALLLTRGIQNFTPYKSRPALNQTLDFVLPPGAYPNYGSTFPSDTAGLAFALVLSIWLVSRRWGILALFWAVVVVCFPRLYGGFHYPSDLLAGAAIGLASTYAFVRFTAISNPLFNLTMKLATTHRAWFFVLGFIVAYQTTNYYLDPRKVGEQALFSLGFKQTKLKQLEKQAAERSQPCP